MSKFGFKPAPLNMNKLKSLVFVAMLLLPGITLAPAAPASAGTVSPPAKAEKRVAESQVYKQVGERGLKLFIEKPPGWKTSDQRPAIVFFFGGGWVAGGAEQFRKQSEYLASRGMVGIRVEYRTIPKGEEGPPTVCVQDAKSAMRWVRAHAQELGVNPERIAAGGGSAGGHLAAFTGLVAGLDDPNDDLKVSPKPEALVLFNPVFNNGPGQWGHEKVGNRYREFSPAHNISSNAPPTIIFLGRKDSLISVKTVEEFQAGMRLVGARCEAFFYDDQVHGFFNREPWRTRTLIEADKFLAWLGWLEGKPTLAEPPAGAETKTADGKALPGAAKPDKASK